MAEDATTAGEEDTATNNLSPKALTPITEIKTTLDDAIAETGHGKFHCLVLFSAAMCMGAMASEIICISFVMPAAECDLSLSQKDKGLMSGIGYIGMMLSSPLWGYLADTKGRRRILLITLMGDWVCNVACSLAPNFSTIVFMRFWNGFFICGPAAVTYAYLGEFHTAQTRTKAILWGSFSIAGAKVVIPVVAWLVIPMQWTVVLPWGAYNPWRLFMLSCGLPSLFAWALLFFFCPESPKYYYAAGREDDALEVLRHMYAMNKGRSPDSYPVDRLDGEGMPSLILFPKVTWLGIPKSIWAQTAPLFLPPLLRNALLAWFLMFGIYSGFNVFYVWLPEIFNKIANCGDSHSGQFFVVCTVLSSTSPCTAKLNGTQTSDALTNFATVKPRQGGEFRMLTDNRSAASAERCPDTVDSMVFRNQMMIGFASALVYPFAGWVSNHCGRRSILFSTLGISSASFVGVYCVGTSNQVLGLACIIISLCSLSVNVLSSVIVDIFPTKYRAMALCLALMCGRLGVASGSFTLGAALVKHCPAVIFTMAAISFACALLSYLLPRLPRGGTPH